MRPVYQTIPASPPTNGDPVPCDQYISPFNLSLQVIITGAPNYTVQYTFDDVFSPTYTPASGTWTDLTALTAQTTTKDSNVAYPVSAVRCRTNSGTGSVQFIVRQAGLGGT